ncbi:unnamed protein product, partial [Phaeothamnion confervicola]
MEVIRRLAKEHKGKVHRLAPTALKMALEKKGVSRALEGDTALYDLVSHLACQRPVPLSLRQLYTFGKRPTAEGRLQNVRFLHRELPIRLSQRAEELMYLPHGLSAVAGIQQVATCYAHFALELFRVPKPETTEENAAVPTAPACICHHHCHHHHRHRCRIGAPSLPPPSPPPPPKSPSPLPPLPLQRAGACLHVPAGERDPG